MNYLHFYNYEYATDGHTSRDNAGEPNATIIGVTSKYGVPELTGQAFRLAVNARQQTVEKELEAQHSEPELLHDETDQSKAKVLFRVVANTELVHKPHPTFRSRIEHIPFPSESKIGPNNYAIGHLALLVMPPLTEREEADLESAFRMALAGTSEANERFDTSEVEQVIMDEMQKDPEATAKMPIIHDV